MKKALLLITTIWIITGCTTQQPTNQSTASGSENAQQTEQITVNISVDGKPIEGSPFKWQVEKDTTLLDAMKQNLEIKEDNGFVSSINGYIQNEGNYKDKWWLFDYNGKMSEVGAAEIKLQPGDVVDWKLEAFES